MTRPRAAVQLDATIELAIRIRDRLPFLVDHVARERALLDGYPAGGGDGTGRRGTAELTTVEAAAQARGQLDKHTRFITESITALAMTARDILDTIDRTLGIRAPATTHTERPAERCNGHVDPTCTNWASEHHTADGTTIGGLCDQCWTTACPRCHARAVPQYRTLCDACRKQIERDGRAA